MNKFMFARVRFDFSGKKIFFFTLLISTAFVMSGCSNQPKAISVEVIPDASSSQAVSAAVSATPASANPAPAPAAVATPTAVTPTVKQTTQIPSRFLLDMAFAQQAPFGNWDAVHEETCEEASMIMADKYFKYQPLNEQIMEQELQKLLAWENDRGYKVDLTAQQTVDILKEYFGLTARFSSNVTVDQIKYELSQGKPIIVPAAGQALGNPNFKAPGPIYHMLVIKGYNDTQFITNDPGTRKGNSYVYSYNALLNAIHDWNPDLAVPSMTPANMLKGAKVMVVVDK